MERPHASIVQVRDAADKPWRDLVVMPFERALFAGEVFVGSLVAGFDPDGKSLVIHSALHSDKGRLVRVDLRSGKELGVVAQDPQSDVADQDEMVAPKILTRSDDECGRGRALRLHTPHWVFSIRKWKLILPRSGHEVSGLYRSGQPRPCRSQMDHRRAPKRSACIRITCSIAKRRK